MVHYFRSTDSQSPEVLRPRYFLSTSDVYTTPAILTNGTLSGKGAVDEAERKTFHTLSVSGLSPASRVTRLN